MALDELGRGTATLDGAAIAWAVLDHMAHQVGCRGLFATHYHALCTAVEDDARVAVMHMACAVGGVTGEGQEEEGCDMEVDGHAAGEKIEAAVPEVTFLYKLSPGAWLLWLCLADVGIDIAALTCLYNTTRCLHLRHAVEQLQHVSVAAMWANYVVHRLVQKVV